jgi:hypothetical protein
MEGTKFRLASFRKKKRAAFINPCFSVMGFGVDSAAEGGNFGLSSVINVNPEFGLLVGPDGRIGRIDLEDALADPFIIGIKMTARQINLKGIITEGDNFKGGIFIEPQIGSIAQIEFRMAPLRRPDAIPFLDGHINRGRHPISRLLRPNLDIPFDQADAHDIQSGESLDWKKQKYGEKRQTFQYVHLVAPFFLYILHSPISLTFT